jgi:hypothetical protein
MVARCRKAAEADQGQLWRFARWLGIRAAFLFLRLRFWANAIPLLALMLALIASASERVDDAPTHANK